MLTLGNLPMDKASWPAGSAAAAAAANEEPTGKKLKGEEGKEEVVPSLSIEDVLDSHFGAQPLEAVEWSHLGPGVKAAGSSTSGLSNFPPHLLVQINKMEMDQNFAVKKIKVDVPMPDVLDLTNYRTKRIPGEILAQDPPPGEEPALNEEVLAQLMSMGFSKNGCKKAMTATGGADVEAATNYIFGHMEVSGGSGGAFRGQAGGSFSHFSHTPPFFATSFVCFFQDPGFNDEAVPAPAAAAAAAAAPSPVDEGAVQDLVANLGMFTADQVRPVFVHCDGSAERAADWLFSHMDSLDADIAALGGAGGGGGGGGERDGEGGGGGEAALGDGPGVYSLRAIISHVGPNTSSGHYVAHVKDPTGNWIIMNDDAVALSRRVPREKGFVYLYERK